MVDLPNIGIVPIVEHNQMAFLDPITTADIPQGDLENWRIMG